MKKIKDASAVTGKYTDSEGKEKNRYMTIGALFQRDDESLTLKLEAIPLNFNGWVNFYDPKPRDGAEKTLSAPVPAGPPKAKANDFDDEIPF